MTPAVFAFMVYVKAMDIVLDRSNAVAPGAFLNRVESVTKRTRNALRKSGEQEK